jgi:glucose/arabinose dehydrogenase
MAWRSSSKSRRVSAANRPIPLRRFWQLALVELEDRVTPANPAMPVIIEPFSEGQLTGTFDVNMQTDPAKYSDPDGNAWRATDWRIKDTTTGQVVWQLPFSSAPPLTLYRVDFSDGAFVGPLAGRTELNYDTNYQLVVSYRDSAGEVSAPAVRDFHTAGATQPVPGAGTWLVRPGYVVEPVETGLRLPVNIAFVPNPGPNPSDPLYYVTELYGSIRVVRRDGTMQTFATGLLDYNPQGPISGVGEQGLTGLAVERDSANPAIYHLYVGMLWDNGNPAPAPNHYPKVERLDSVAGGLAMASRTLLINMQPATQGQSHLISNISIGPDGKLYVHMGDSFEPATALNLDDYRGKVLRMNKDGTPVATGDPAGANPFYNAADGINARDYVFTYGHRNPFGGAWRPADGKQWIVENGDNVDRLVDLTAGASYGWAGNDATHIQYSKFYWNPAVAPVNIDFVDPSRFGGSGFPASEQGHAFVSLSGSTYASGPIQTSKGIVDFPDLDTLGPDGKLLVQPSFLVKYNGTGRATVAGLAAGPDGLYFTDLYEDTGAGGATGIGANVYRIRYVGGGGGQVPTVATAASATPNPVNAGSTANLSALGADDGGEANLVYTWGVLGNPPGPVGFSVNGSNSAKNTVATFTANGTYDLYVSIRDAGSQTAISNVTITVTSVIAGTGNGVVGTYYAGQHFDGAAITRTDSAINFDWGFGSPDPAIGVNNFSVRWTGFVQPRFSGTYTFYTTTDDGVRLYVNNQLIVDHFVDQGATTWTGTIDLVAGQQYALQMDYYENGDSASARLEWQSASQVREVVPQTQLYTTSGGPTAPSNLAATAASAGTVNLTWSPSTAANGYYVEQSADGVNGWVQVATTTGPSVQIGGLAAQTTYFFRLRAYNAFGTSAYSSVAVATTTSQSNTLDFATGFGSVPGGTFTFVGGAAIVNSRLRLTSGGNDQIRAVYATNPQTISGFTTSFTYTKVGTADGLTFVIQRDPRGLAALGDEGGQLGYDGSFAIMPSLAFAINIFNGHPFGTEFVTNGDVDGNYAQSVINTSLDNAPITVTITYTGGLTVTATLTQQGITGSEIKSFTLPSDLSTFLGGSTAVVGFTAATGAVNSTQEITAWTFQPTSSPGVPTNFQAQPTGYVGGSTQTAALGAHLTWAAAPGATSYLIERKLTASGTYQQVGTSTGPTFDDTGLAIQSTYYYRVRGVNAIGTGSYSVEATATTPSAVSATSGAQTVGVTTTAVTLSWIDNANNEDGFQILRRVGGTGSFTLLANVPANATASPSAVSYTDSGLAPGTRYDYRVQSYNLAGPSIFSVIPTATRTPAPTGLSAHAASSAINLAWTATPGADTYSVYRATSTGGQGATPLVTGLTVPAYSDTTVAFGPTYYYVVTAFTLGGESNRSVEALATLGSAPTVAGVIVNDGSTQRSMVRSLTVTFSGPVTFANNNPTAAFSLTRVSTGGGSVGLLAATPTLDGQGRTVVTLTFSGTTTTDSASAQHGGALSLADGRYQLAIADGAVTGTNGAALDGDGNGSAGGAYTSPADTAAGGPVQLRLFRLFGDATGDGVVDALDLQVLRTTINSSTGSAFFLPYLDGNNDGVIDAFDLQTLRNTINTNLFGP